MFNKAVDIYLRTTGYLTARVADAWFNKLDRHTDGSPLTDIEKVYVRFGMAALQVSTDALTDKRCTIPAEAKTVIANNYVRAMMAANSLR